MRKLAPAIRRTIDARSVKPPAKTADPIYLSLEHKAWRQAVCQRAGWRCEALDQHGMRCRKSAPDHRMFADHIREVSDGGDRFDLANGQCLCGSHHTVKTTQERARRLGNRGG